MVGEADKQTVDVAAITKSVTEAVTKTITESVTKQLTDTFGTQITELGKNVKILGDTIANDKKQAGKKPGDKKLDSDGEGDDTGAKPLTEEEIDKRVNARLETILKDRDDKAIAATKRQGVIDRLKKEKLGGDDELAALLTGEDEAALIAAADKIAAKFKVTKPDFGDGTKDGGNLPGDKKTDGPAPLGNLSEGTAKFAAGIKLPS